MAGTREPRNEDLESSAEKPQAEFGYPDEDEEGLYGWRFHKGPLLAAIILTVIFYVFVFLWVD